MNYNMIKKILLFVLGLHALFLLCVLVLFWDVTRYNLSIISSAKLILHNVSHRTCQVEFDDIDKFISEEFGKIDGKVILRAAYNTGPNVDLVVNDVKAYKKCSPGSKIFKSDTDTSNIVLYGDSLTAAEGGVGDIGLNLNIPTVNRAVGGWAGSEIAIRSGAINPKINLHGGALPSSGRVEISEIIPAEGWSPYVSSKITGTLAGVKVTLLRNHKENNWIIERSDAGQEIKLEHDTEFISDENSKYRTYFQIIWIGRNLVNTENFARNTLSAIQAIVEHRTALDNRFVIISVTNGQNEHKDTVQYKRIIELNSEIQRRYPDNYFDLRHNFNAEGLSAAGFPLSTGGGENYNDTPPTILMKDNVHPNALGYEVQRKMLANFIEKRGLIK